MPIEIEHPPQNAINVVTSTLQELALKNLFRPRSPLADSKFEELKLVYPHPVYYLDLENIFVENPMEKALSICWRFLIEKDKAVKSSIEVLTDEDDSEKYVLNALDGGIYNGLIVSALERLNQNRKVKHGNFSFRTFEDPSMNLMAVWLKDKENMEGDYFSLLDRSDAKLSVGTLYSSNFFINALKKPARQILDNPDLLEG
jgi:hypothetical protein